ncbi:MAG: rubredoxin [Bacteroidales bacterium]|nr:rubredoxin [Bacteroidales bacterium]
MKYICEICGYVYDDEKEEIPFSELPEDYVCPLCGAEKTEFSEDNGNK